MTSAATDEDLVRLCREGKEGAFKELYERYRKPVFSTALRITRDFAEAQDATQEIFIRVHLSMSDWDPRKSRFSTWLYRMATNRAIDRWRAARRRARICGTGGIIHVPSEVRHSAAVMPSPFQELERKEQARKVRSCIDALPELQKKLVLLRYVQGLKLEEIAEAEKRSLGTVKTTLFRAVKAMRGRLMKIW